MSNESSESSNINNYIKVVRDRREDEVAAGLRVSPVVEVICFDDRERTACIDAMVRASDLVTSTARARAIVYRVPTNANADFFRRWPVVGKSGRGLLREGAAA